MTESEAKMWHSSVLLCLHAMLRISLVKTAENEQFIDACIDEVYCKGEILKVVQMSKAFGDAKTFVDMPMRDDRSKIVTPLKDAVNGQKSAADIKKAVKKYFYEAGTELTSIQPSDWSENPPILLKIKDPSLRDWAKDIHNRWKLLNRKMKKEVKTNPERYSLLYSENPFVVPGGRFREFYYWDTYWVVNGLLLSGMAETVKGMLQNFITLVKDQGFVPNGGRKYYLNRSQPPFLSLMVYEYWKKTNDTKFLTESLPYLEKEYQFWMTNRTITLDKTDGLKHAYDVNRFSTPMGYPRPESYWNDVETMEKAGIHNGTERKQLYAHIASAAESGWDFSSRWFSYSGKHAMKMMSIKTRDIIPVDLNSILCKVEKSLSEMHAANGNSAKEKQFTTAYQGRVTTMNEVFWDENKKQWLDFDIKLKKPRSAFYVSNISPIWADCYGNNATRAKEAIRSIKRQGVLDYPGGVPTTLNETGEQWDFPNAWPPLQDMMENALRKAGNITGNDLAFDLARKWIETNYLSWKQTGHMYEKYDANIRGKPGHGGEYGVQVGFGWTNGVVLQFLDRYGQRLKAPKYKPPDNSAPNPMVAIEALLILLVLTLMLTNFH